MKKAVIVGVNVPKKHKFYSKDIKLTKRFRAQDTVGCVAGDLVTIEESKPISRTISWVVVEKLEEEK